MIPPHINKVILSGTISGQPQLCYTEGNVPITEFNLTVWLCTKKEGGGNEVSRTEFPVIAKAGLAQNIVMEMKTIGYPMAEVLIEGILQITKWEDAPKDTRVNVSIIAQTFQNLGEAEERLPF